MTPAEAARLQLLKLIERAPGLSQCELGVSLGKSHYLLWALVEKGLVKANNFRRNDNNLACAYLLTPAGVSEKVRLARDCLRRSEAEYPAIVAEIAALRNEIGILDGRELASDCGFKTIGVERHS